MNPLSNKPFTFDRVVRIVFSVLIAGLCVYLLVMVKHALLPFFIAAFLAYMLQPFVKFFQYKVKIKNRLAAIGITLLSIILFFSLVSIMVMPSIVNETNKTIELIRSHNFYDTHPSYIPDAWITFLKENVDLKQITESINQENLIKFVQEVAPRMWSLVSNTFSILFGITIVFVILLYFIFILIDYERISEGWIKLIPEAHRPFVQKLAEDVEFSMNRYFRGQSLIALCVGILLALGFHIIDFPLAVLLGLSIGVLNLIPYMQAIGIIPMVLLSLLKSAQTGQNFWVIFGLAMLVLGIVQAIQDLFLTPRIMGKAMGLNPAIILLSLSIWGTLLGFLGLIIGLPLTTLCLSYYKRFILHEKTEKEAKTRKIEKK